MFLPEETIAAAGGTSTYLRGFPMNETTANGVVNCGVTFNNQPSSTSVLAGGFMNATVPAVGGCLQSHIIDPIFAVSSVCLICT